jgi:DNA-binding NtrC family response regulator
MKSQGASATLGLGRFFQPHGADESALICRFDFLEKRGTTMAAIATPGFARLRSRILVASADACFRQRLLKDPTYADAQGEEAVGGAHALTKLTELPCDSVLLDRNLPDLDAAEVAEQIRRQFPRTVVELVDSRTEHSGRHDVEIRDDPAPLGGDGEAAAIRKDEEFWKAQHAEPMAEPLRGMIGSSRVMRQVYRLARMVAGRDIAVLITGETGTGKELVAAAIHDLSRRARNPMVVVNCAAIPEALLEAELFGHVRGAFTGAVQSRLGRIHVAQGGTLFLDEVGELPLSMQAKLLRFLQNGEVQRLGSPDVYRVDVRVVCATNVQLLDLVKAKQFRLDLYYRLAIFPIAMPPLRERPEDVPGLAEHFLERLSSEAGVAEKHLSAVALARLQKAAWAGNVRELQHAIERAFILAGNETMLGVEHFQPFGEGSVLREI